MHIALQRAGIVNGRARNVVQVMVRDRTVICRLVRIINGPTGYHTVSPVCVGGLSLVGPAWLSFVRPNGSGVHAYEQGPGVCGGVAVNGVRWLIDPGQLWSLIRSLAAGRG